MYNFNSESNVFMAMLEWKRESVKRPLTDTEYYEHSRRSVREHGTQRIFRYRRKIPTRCTLNAASPTQYTPQGVYFFLYSPV